MRRHTGGPVTEHLLHRAITALDSPRDEATVLQRYPDRPWNRTCVERELATGRRSTKALSFDPGGAVDVWLRTLGMASRTMLEANARYTLVGYGANEASTMTDLAAANKISCLGDP
jgi:hypothetical protein